ncbi:MAG TPA: carboxypeptidase-like regulatory domain-containing protein [Candidatus Dormibacteraeota bacterium]|nr:carboxypeptidase-like regulatory domain-containing protein [Candidatus Dormibacteraeota bacterium]
MSTNWRVKLLVLCFLIFGLVSEAGPMPVHDYIFGVTGVVTGEDGQALQGAEITLHLTGPVFKGAELIETAKRVTDDTGGFVFTYLCHKRGVKYTIAVRKEGFEPQVVAGSAPPAGHHTVRLKRATGMPNGGP